MVELFEGGVIGVVIGGIVTALGAYYKFRITSTKVAHDQQSEFITRLMEQSEKLADRLTEYQELKVEQDRQVRDMQHEIVQLRDEIRVLRDEIAYRDKHLLHPHAGQVLEAVMNWYPQPCWLHEVGANSWYINDAYSKIYHVPRPDFWTPVNVLQAFPIESAAEFVENDMKVLQDRVPFCAMERFPRRIMEVVSAANPAQDVRVVKFPVEIGGTKYVFGKCYPEGVADNLFDAFAS